MEEINSLGTDKITKAKAYYLLLIFVLSFILLFSLANIPQEASRANFYLTMVSLCFIAVLIDWGLKTAKLNIIDVVTEEPREIAPISKVNKLFGSYPAMFFLGLVITIYFIFNISATSQSIVAAPSFQAIPIEILENPIYKGFMSGIVGILENLFFFGVFFGTAYAILQRGVKFFFKIENKWIALVLAVILTSLFFTGFHWFVYGTANLLALQSTFVFGALNCILKYIFRSEVIGSMWHFGNNFAVVFFRTVSLGI